MPLPFNHSLSLMHSREAEWVGSLLSDQRTLIQDTVSATEVSKWKHDQLQPSEINKLHLTLTSDLPVKRGKLRQFLYWIDIHLLEILHQTAKLFNARKSPWSMCQWVHYMLSLPSKAWKIVKYKKQQMFSQLSFLTHSWIAHFWKMCLYPVTLQDINTF